jgi:transposase
MREYIGIDISKTSIDVYDGKKSYKFENNTTGFEATVALVDDIEKSVFIFEPTGVYSYALTQFCSQKRINIVMVGPKESRDFARSLKVRSKTDKIDAKVLYRYQSQIEPGMIKVPVVNHQGIKIQEMLNVYEGICSAAQKFKNQIESTSKENKELLHTLNKMIKDLEAQALKLFNKIELTLLNDEKTKARYEAISTIPAIGQKSALYLTAFFLKYPMANAKEITALMGLDPMMRDSGTYRGKQKISKHGGQQLRDLLYLPTLSALKYNDRIKVFYERLTSQAKPKKLAVIASMRKLVLMAFSIFNSLEVYRKLEVKAQ